MKLKKIIRNIFDNLRFGLFDQSFVRQGNKQKIKLANCKGNPLSVSLSGIIRNLRYPDEFVRHKILDLIGDLYLLGYPLRGRVVANMTSHGYNQALVQKLHVALTT